MKYPPYSILISLYEKERPEYLQESLDSIFRQSVYPDEIVVVKDGALTDELEAVLDSYSDKHPGLFTFIAYPENKGLWYALNVGVPACRNELIMRMDVDDWMAPERAEKQLKVFVKNPDYGCVGTLVIEFEGDISHPIAFVDLPEGHDEIVRFGKKRNPMRHPAVMFKKSVVLAAGNYQEMPFFEDYDLYMRMVSTGCIFYNIQKCLVYMRTNQGFYARRGGLAYMRKMLRFKRACLNRGDYTLSEFVACTAPHVVACLIPNGLRAFVYRHMLRSKPTGKKPNE